MGSSPRVTSLQEHPVTSAPNFTPGQKWSSYLSSTHSPPGTAVSTSWALSATLLRSITVRKTVNKEANSGVETCQSLVSAERKCARATESLEQQQQQKWLMWQTEQIQGRREEAQAGTHSLARAGQCIVLRPHGRPLQSPGWALLAALVEPGQLGHKDRLARAQKKTGDNFPETISLPSKNIFLCANKSVCTQQSNSVSYINMHIYNTYNICIFSIHTYIFFFRFFSIISYYKILNIILCAI